MPQRSETSCSSLVMFQCTMYTLLTLNHSHLEILKSSLLCGKKLEVWYILNWISPTLDVQVAVHRIYFTLLHTPMTVVGFLSLLNLYWLHAIPFSFLVRNTVVYFPHWYVKKNASKWLQKIWRKKYSILYNNIII